MLTLSIPDTKSRRSSIPHSRTPNRPIKVFPSNGDLIFDLVTLRSCWCVDLVHTYLPFEYGDDQRSLRSSNAHFKVWPLTPYIWPWFWPCDLEVVQGCWACPYLRTIWIWWWSEVIKVVKHPFQGLTFDPLYLTLWVKIQNSATLIFCVWSQGTFLCVYSILLS